MRRSPPPPAVLVLLLAMAAAAGPARAQGNDATTTGAAAGRGSSTHAVEVGVLTTTEVTTGQSGPASQGQGDAEAGPTDRRQRVLGPVCDDLRGQPEVLAQCRAKAGLARE
jgi:hypothetical protein